MWLVSSGRGGKRRQPRGAQPSIVLLHGWAGDSSTWRQVESLLGTAGAAIDLPGHGNDREDVTGWSIGDFADAVERERVRRGADCLVIGAHSNGAYVAREYVRRYPKRAAALVIVEGTFLKPFDDVARFAAFRSTIEKSWEKMRDRPPGLTNARAETAVVVRDMAARASLRSALATFDMLLPDTAWSADVVTVPVTFMLAEAPSWTDEHLKRLRAMAPGASFVRLGRVSHYAHLDRPEDVAMALRQSAAVNCPE